MNKEEVEKLYYDILKIIDKHLEPHEEENINFNGVKNYNIIFYPNFNGLHLGFTDYDNKDFIIKEFSISYDNFKILMDYFKENDLSKLEGFKNIAIAKHRTSLILEI